VQVGKYNLVSLAEMSFEELVQTLRNKSRSSLPGDMRGVVKLQ
jgi:hypothetical protein